MSDLLLDIGPGSARSATIELRLRAAVVGGRLVAGSRLPSTRELARELGCARATVVSAYEQLVAEGYLLASPGSGTIVAEVRTSATPDLVATPRPTSHPALFTDLVPGEPDPSSFPRRGWATSIRNVMNTAPDSVFGYGDERGLDVLRAELAAYLARSRAVVADPSRIVVFAGFRSALSVLSSTLSRLGIDRVAVEDPGLPPLSRVIAASGPRIVAVPVDDEGLCVDQLGSERVVLCTPAHQYPTGVVLSPRRRSALIDRARALDGWIIEDDYDGEFRYDARPVGAMQGLDPERVIYGGTTSKVLAPGVAIAWLVLPTTLLEPVIETKKARRDVVSTIEQAAFADFLASGRLDRHLRAQRHHYRRRRDAVLRVLADTAPWLEPAGISAGLHVTARLHGRVERDVIDTAARRSVVLFGIANHRIERPARPGLVLGYSRSPAHAFPRALDELAAVLREA